MVKKHFSKVKQLENRKFTNPTKIGAHFRANCPFLFFLICYIMVFVKVAPFFQKKENFPPIEEKFFFKEKRIWLTLTQFDEMKKGE